jgi:hypothetical protein
MLKRKLGASGELLFARTESVQPVRRLKGWYDCTSGQAACQVTKFEIGHLARFRIYVAQFSTGNLQNVDWRANG